MAQAFSGFEQIEKIHHGGKSLIVRGYDVANKRAVVRVALQIVAQLAAIHAHNVLHKDVNPSNIVWNREAGILKIVDFGVASVFSWESPSENPSSLIGTLAYIAPEQTGRMNRSIDYRANIYSFTMLARCLEKDASWVSSALGQAIEESVLLPVSLPVGVSTTRTGAGGMLGDVRFTHDRVQQGAAALKANTYSLPIVRIGC